MITKGSHGPSGVYAVEWRQLLTAYKSSSNSPHKNLTNIADRIATEQLNFLNLNTSDTVTLLPTCPIRFEMMSK